MDGHRVYNIMQRVTQFFFPYDKLENTAQDDSVARRKETSYSTCDTSERPPRVIVPCRGKTAATTEIA